MFKAICTDIDGTLLNPERELSKRTIDIIRSLKNDIAVVLASSRMPAAMRHLQESLDIANQPLICYNGGYVISQTSGVTVLDSVTIPFALCEFVAKWCHNENLHAGFYLDDDWFAPSEDQWTQREINNTKVQASIFPSLDLMESWKTQEKGAHKIMCMGEPKLIDNLVAKLISIDAPLHLYRSKDTYLEIAPLQISKASALSQLLQAEFNIEMRDVIAFGDNYNDIEMLKAVGCGVAVGNAKDEVKEIADEITLPGKEDGVAATLEKYFG
ncbi:hydrolase [Marivirga tractuosa]|uniref:Cof-like hydrolase n=1 Tax=Marivirga tractuosa (strain ATCC 23168 / DSM 4126 / NBRC 15989 / NCIMB 1408 / VKM B-1430 / H-43) TaxID=643867 RepID=E4TQU8_MARTH|nr:Cof-type HAD-IIB family hydrolase [Marivirga tractuosa]ADR21648.1 Cof-like hydrolase [Marivirga tractuosa DSM 4126]BDD13895.1 hydrolase [Marivirga tractuosa]